MSYCPWCHYNIVVHINGTPAGRVREDYKADGILFARSFAAHIQACEVAPESAKAAYLEPYP